MEIWKSIPSFSNYEASNLGNLRSLNYKRTGTCKVLKPSKSNDGYLKTMLLSDDGKYKSRTVHSFICAAFLGPRQEGMQINHINSDRTDNRIENLEYCTPSENALHSYKTNNKKRMVGSLNGMAKLKESDVVEIRLHAENNGRYYGRKELALKYNVSECTIKEIVTRRKNKFYNA
jgi:hypothetical protein